DPNQIIEIRGLIKDLAKDHTIILSTHILPEVSMTCGRVVIINEGEIVAVDSVANLEKAAAGKPTWKINLKMGTDKEWRKIVEKVAGSEIFDLHESSDAFEFKLRLEKVEDFDAIFQQLTATGGIFREISPVKATLEDVFLKLTSGEERREAA
ncbi:MAG: hypothetical protein PHD82_15015, partial [Candidatus Riflebacteria bacterium]|nr:hypothetical protein [Candidatus Riflebacteria bacterium]